MAEVAYEGARRREVHEAISEQDDACSGAETTQGIGREVPTEDDDGRTCGGDDGRAEEDGRESEWPRNEEDGAEDKRGHCGSRARRVGRTPMDAEVTTYEGLCQLDDEYRHRWRRGAGDRPDSITSQTRYEQHENSRNEPR